VSIRALLADSLEYFGEIADGNTASVFAPLPDVAGGRGTSVVAAGAVPAAGAFVEDAEALVPHSAFRKSFDFIPLSVPPDRAALYLALHSCIVRANAADTAAMSNAAPNIPAQMITERMNTTHPSQLHEVPSLMHQLQRYYKCSVSGTYSLLDQLVAMRLEIEKSMRLVERRLVKNPDNADHLNTFRDLRESLRQITEVEQLVKCPAGESSRTVHL
jgi:hypothetical protein